MSQIIHAAPPLGILTRLHREPRHHPVTEVVVLAFETVTILAESSVMFHCPCDLDRVRTAAAALGREDLQELLVTEQDLKVSCDYCREDYVLGVVDFRHILDATAGS